MELDDSGSHCLHRKYKKTQGHVTTHGPHFEIYLGALLYLRILQRSSRFLLGSNMNDFTPFDDLCLVFEEEDSKELHACFVQLKHVNNNTAITVTKLKNEKQGFSLLKYYDGYLKIKNAIIKQDKNLDMITMITNLKIENCTFALFSNCKCCHKSPEENNLCNREEILNAGGEVFSFGPEDKELWDLVNDPEKSETYHEFLKKLRIFGNQCQLANLCNLIKYEIKKCLPEISVNLEYIFQAYVTEMENWWNEDRRFLSKTFSPWLKTLMTHYNTPIVNLLQKFAYEFHADRCDILQKHLKENPLLFVIVPGGKKGLRCLKIFLELERDYKKRYLLVDEMSAISNRCNIELLLKSGNCKVLVIDTDNYSNVEPFLNLGNVVCVSQKQLHTNVCFTVTDLWTLDSLTETSQTEILKSKVTFQGKEVNVEKLWDNNLSSSVVVELLQNRSFTIGSPLSQKDSIYIERTLTHHPALSEDVFSTIEENNILAISGLPHDDNCSLEYLELKDMFEEEDSVIESKHKCVVLSYADRHQSFPFETHDAPKYEEICKQFEEYNVHWLIYKNGLPIWKASSKNEGILSQYLINMSSCCEIKDICSHKDSHTVNCKQKLILIIGEPGIGKTTLLFHLATEIKQRDPSLWVIPVVLNDITSYLHDLDDENLSLQQVIDILMLMTVHSEISASQHIHRLLLEESLHNKGNIIVLFDGVDEISPIYLSKVLKMVHVLMSTQLRQLWLTSRTILQEQLQRNLQSIPLELKPFTEEEQKRFLVEYLQNEGNDVNHVDSILQILESCKKRKSRNKHVCSIPLHSRIVADMIGKANPTNVEKKVFNICRIYEYFFCQKQNIYNKKCNINTSSLQYISSSHERERFMEQLMNCALLSFFDQQELDLLNINMSCLRDKVKKFTEDILYEKIGVIDGDSNGKPKFVHYTFCEYFVAMWFYKNKKFSDEIINIWFTDRLELVRLFFDLMMARDHLLHEAVLTGQLKYHNISDNLQTELAKVDESGRLPLHLAAAHGYSRQAVYFLEQHSPTDVKDKIFEWKPLQYALKVGAWKIADKIVECSKDKKECTEMLRNYTNVFDFVQHGYVNLVKLLVQMEFDFNVFDDNGWSPLTWAAFKGHLELAEILSVYVDIERKCKVGSTALMKAVKARHIDIVKLLLDKGADVNCQDNNGFTPLIYGAYGGCLKMVQLLLDRDADVNKKTKRGVTALIKAVRARQAKVVRLLLKKQANVNVLDNEGSSPLMWAVCKGHALLTKLLLEHDADIHMRNKKGYTAMKYAITTNNLNLLPLLLEKYDSVQNWNKRGLSDLEYAAYEGNIAKVSSLILSKAYVLNENRTNVLKFAVVGLHYQIVSNLVSMKCGIEVDAIDKHGWTPLIWSVCKNDVSLTKALLDNSADVNRKSENGHTALSLAAVLGYCDVAELLIDREAHVNVKDQGGWTPLMWSVSNGNLRLTKLLLNKGADHNMCCVKGKTALIKAVEGGSQDMVELLLEKGANPNITDLNKWSPLICAANKGNKKLVEILLDAGATIDQQCCDGETALKKALYKEKYDVVQLLLNRCANVNIKDNNGYSPLMTAARRGSAVMIRALLAKQAECNTTNVNGTTALKVAVDKQQCEIVDILLENGADANICDKGGWNPLMSATNAGHMTILKKLLDCKEPICLTYKTVEAAWKIAKKNKNTEVIGILKRRMNAERERRRSEC